MYVDNTFKLYLKSGSIYSTSVLSPNSTTLERMAGLELGAVINTSFKYVFKYLDAK